MARYSVWTIEHIDFLQKLTELPARPTYVEMSTEMSKQFRMRITPSQIGMLLGRMRKRNDVFYRDLPYQTRNR